MVIGLTGTTVALIRATKAETRASAKAAKAQAINAFLLDTLGSANPIAGGRKDVTVLEVLDGAADTISHCFADQPEIEAAVSNTMGQTYLRLSQYEKAEPLLARGLELQKNVLGDDHLTTLESLLWLGLAHMEQGKLDEAERFYQEARSGFRRLPDDTSQEARAELLSLSRLLPSDWDRWQRRLARTWSPSYRASVRYLGQARESRGISRHRRRGGGHRR